MHISGIEPASVIFAKQSNSKNWKVMPKTAKQVKQEGLV